MTKFFKRLFFLIIAAITACESQAYMVSYVLYGDYLLDEEYEEGDMVEAPDLVPYEEGVRYEYDATFPFRMPQGDVIINVREVTETYKLTLHVAGQTFVMDYNAGQLVNIVLPQAFQTKGYKIKWNNLPDEMPAEDVEATAEYVPVDYPIFYELGGGVNASENPSTYNIETPTFALAEPTRQDFIFAGWVDINGMEATQLEQGSTGSKTFYAKWTEVSSVQSVVPELPFYVSGRTIVFTSARNVKFAIYSITGALITSREAQSYTLEKSGMYLMRVGQRTYKVIIK